MDRGEAMDALPAVYRSALELRDLGVADDEIAIRLGVDAEAVVALLAIGESKLARLLDSAPPDPS